MYNPYLSKGIANKNLVAPQAAINKDIAHGKQVLNIVN